MEALRRNVVGRMRTIRTESKSLLQLFRLEHCIGRFFFLNYKTKASLKYLFDTRTHLSCDLTIIFTFLFIYYF